jgi:phage/plasmid-like protein (TIGR03299 family)
MTDTQFTTREMPWTKLGTVIDQPVSPAEAIRLAGLDWGVELSPLKTTFKGKTIDVPDRYAVLRDTDGKVLGNVGSKYETFHNTEAFEFFEPITANGDGAIVAAGSLRNDRVPFIVAKAPLPFSVLDADEHNLFWLLRTSHDGTKAVEVAQMIIRGQCMNQLGMPSFTRNAEQRWAVPHVSNLRDKLREAEHVLSATEDYVASFTETAERLAAVDLEVEEFRAMLTTIMPERPRTVEVIDKMAALFTGSDTHEHTGNGWGAVNAVSEYFDWMRNTSSEEARLFVSVDGQAARTRSRVAAMLLAR